MPTNQLKKIFLGLAKGYSGQAPASWLESALEPGQYGRRWPRNDEFRTAWSRFPLYMRKERCRIILELLEQNHAHKEPALLENATIEHVVPRTLNPWWNEHLGQDVDAHADFVHTVGNLTLTGYNSELSNSPYPDKQKLFTDSHFSMNAYFAAAGSWRREQIDERAAALFERALRMWPRPSEPAA